MMPILQMKKLSLTEVKPLAQGHTVSNSQMEIRSDAGILPTASCTQLTGKLWSEDSCSLGRNLHPAGFSVKFFHIWNWWKRLRREIREAKASY